MWHSEWDLLVCTAGKARNLWGATKDKQSYKSIHRAEISHISSTILIYARTGAITPTHSNPRKIRYGPERKKAGEGKRPLNTWRGQQTNAAQNT